MSYPDDTEFIDRTIAKVSDSSGGWELRFDDGLCFFCPADSPVTPEPGMVARQFGPAFGCVRGLYIDKQRVFYRTAEEDKDYRANQMYGVTALDALERWDSGRPVWTIEMGGLGPGYEQTIHVFVFEIIRAASEDGVADLESMRGVADRVAKEHSELLGLSGAQFGAALTIAWRGWTDGWRSMIEKFEEHGGDDTRLIQVSRHFPSIPLPEKVA